METETYEEYVLAEMADAQDRETDPEFSFVYQGLVQEAR